MCGACIQVTQVKCKISLGFCIHYVIPYIEVSFIHSPFSVIISQLFISCYLKTSIIYCYKVLHCAVFLTAFFSALIVKSKKHYHNCHLFFFLIHQQKARIILISLAVQTRSGREFSYILFL